ncbi:MAG TPA: 6-phosphofructokinase [Polyangiales bacterium]|nr:6-phosphofructokinase [Polyangiales bacterium]
MQEIQRVGLLFSGGPAPGANAVIAAAASAFRRAGCEVIGILQGYTHLESFKPGQSALHEGTHYRTITDADLRGLRNARGVFLGTARANPGREVNSPQDFEDPVKSAGLAATVAALRELELDALISIGGDGTLRTANLLYEYQRRLPESAQRVRIVHVPKTIDNDYAGIDFTFGFFTAVDVMAKELLNLRADALATQSYYVVSTMGRRAGWLAYGVAIAGEAHLVLGMEDAQGAMLDADGKLDLDRLSELIVELIAARAARGKRYGVVLLAEGLAELLPESVLEGAGRDAYGHVSFGTFDLSRHVSGRAAKRYRDKTGRSIKITGVQLGYESRCAAPHAFDVLLGTQLGFGAFRALTEEDLDGHMVSVAGQLDLHYVAFEKLVDQKSLTPLVRYIDRQSDFYRLARQLGTRVASMR